MIMTAASVLFAACCAAVAVWNIVQRGKLVNTYDALSRKERECEQLKENYESVCKRCERVYADYEEAATELEEARKEVEEARQRTEAVQNALKEVQNIWNYVGNADGQQEVS
ncbi:MAG TPA: hypothetical protein K8V27_09615 [Butyricicoccus pullicaecorum]|nr:hypothetical protein [Butyricicoccus pullicaecorum]